MYVMLLQGPVQYHLYVWYAVVLWDCAGAFGLRTLIQAVAAIVCPNCWSARAVMARVMAALLIELIVVGFFHRAAFSVGNLLLALGAFFLPLSGANSGLRWKWAAACLCASPFTLLSVEFGDEMRLVFAGGLGLFIAAAAGEIGARSRGDRASAGILALQAYLVLMAVVLMAVTLRTFEAQRGLHPVLCALNWATLLLSLWQPLRLKRVSDDAELRLLSLIVGWGTPYMQLSINYETVFLLTLCAQLYLWLRLECATASSSSTSVNTTTSSSASSSPSPSSSSAKSSQVTRRLVSQVVSLPEVSGGSKRKGLGGGRGGGEERGWKGRGEGGVMERYAVTSLVLIFLTNTAFFGALSPPCPPISLDHFLCMCVCTVVEGMI